MRDEKIEILARALIRCQDLVLLCRNTRHGYSYLPGGHVEFGESATQALAREMHEEAGINVLLGPLLAVFELRFQQGKHSRHEISFVFHVELPGVSSSDLPPEVLSREKGIEFDWCQATDLVSTELLPRQLKHWLIEHDPSIPVMWHSDDERPASPAE